MAVILEGKNLVKNYGFNDNIVKAVDGIDIEIEEGSFVAIVGASGSGKSTLLHLLGGLVKPSHGDVLLEGKSIINLSDKKLTILRRRKMGFIFQFFNLISTENVIENIVLPLDLDKKKPDINYIDEIVETLGLTDKKISFIGELSGGQQQRVAIARALASKPAIIFADEPTGNLDSKSSKEVVRLLKTCQQKYNETVVMVTHDEQIASVADRIITIEDGKIIKDIKNNS